MSGLPRKISLAEETVVPDDGPSSRRVITAFVIAPLFAAVFAALLMGGLWIAPLTAVYAYAAAIFLGVPLYHVLRETARPTLRNCLLAGGLTASLPLLLVYFASSFSAAPDNHSFVDNGVRTWAGWWSIAKGVLIVCGFGMIGGFAFWCCLTARPALRSEQ